MCTHVLVERRSWTATPLQQQARFCRGGAINPESSDKGGERISNCTSGLPYTVDSDCGRVCINSALALKKPPQYQKILDDMKEIIRDADPKYDELNDCLHGGRDSSCEELPEDDDGDNGNNKYNCGGGLEQILQPLEMQQHRLPMRHRQRN
jgi:hypothetical protein